MSPSVKWRRHLTHEKLAWPVSSQSLCPACRKCISQRVWIFKRLSCGPAQVSQGCFPTILLKGAFNMAAMRSTSCARGVILATLAWYGCSTLMFCSAFSSKRVQSNTRDRNDSCLLRKAIATKECWQLRVGTAETSGSPNKKGWKPVSQRWWNAQHLTQ